MATLDGTGTNTLLDLAAETGPDGELMKMAMILAQENAILLDALWFQANGTTHHKFVQSLNLPTGSFRMINRGVPVEAAHGTPVTEALAMLDAISQIDCTLVDIAPNPVEFRNNKAIQFVEGMSQTLAKKLIYGNETASPEEITGLAPRLNDAGLTNVVSMGSTSAGGDLTSVYFVHWGENKTYLTYPRGGGGNQLIRHSDDGEQWVDDSETPVGKYKVYQDSFKADIGLAIEDPRCIARLCNIETSGTTDILAVDSKIMGILRRMPNQGANTVMYMNVTTLTQLDVLSYGKASPVTYGPDGDVFGRKVTAFRGHPVRLVEQILDTEALVA